MRRYIRHPAGIPIEVKAQGEKTHDIHNTVNLGVGGLAFRSSRDFAQGEVVEIRITFVQPPFDAEARVAWCKPHGSGFELGVEFLNRDDAFMARMVEQVCHIENYQKTVSRTEGRELSPEDAAREWISKYAAKFPGC
ncbi:MAG: PilZ domain-containing protein [Gallionella sp.]|nr:PilZ domain-containing protein [Gallionella sp.]MDH4285870.1 PilZ domain-containing protein [Gallionella sp.]